MTADYYSCWISVTVEEASQGLHLFETAVTEKFPASSVKFDDGKLFTELFSIDGSRSDEIAEWIMDALIQAFPTLTTESVTHEDDVLGMLTWIRELRSLEGQVELDGCEVDLFLEAPATPTPSALVERAHDIVLRWPNWRQAINPAIVEEGLLLYNDGWRTHDENSDGKILTADEFVDRVLPTTLHINADLGFVVYFFTDGMFADHGITAQVSAANDIVACFE